MSALLSDAELYEYISASVLPELRPSFEKLGSLLMLGAWTDIVAKAKRLIMSGQVTIMRNAPHHVMAHVVGDHGEYNCEISRHDPTSQIIEQWNCECCLPGQQIVMADGSVKAIEDIQVGDVVMTATGRAGIVGRTFSRHYEGVAVGLKMTGSTEVAWFTAEHKLPTADLEVKEAQDWTSADFSFLPQPLYEEVSRIDVRELLPELVESDGWLYRANKLFGSKRVRKVSRPTDVLDLRTHPIPATVEWDESFARIAGLFVAEGTVTPRGELRWHFGPSEEYLADEVSEILRQLFDLPSHKKYAKSCWVVSVSSRFLATLFLHLFGTGARTKKLHQDVMSMPKDSLEVFFDSWVEGDGHAGTARTYLGTSSDHLAMQARLILARLGHESVIRRLQANVSSLVPNGGTFNQIAWRSNGSQDAQGGYNRFFFVDQVYQTMEESATKFYVGKVYNFEVLDSGISGYDEHSYVVAPGIASANCPWAQFAFDRTRKWKKLEGRVCSHVLASYWKAKSTPLDVTDQEEGFAVPPGQRRSPAGPGQQQFPAMPPHPQMGEPGAPGPGVQAPGQQTTVPSPPPEEQLQGQEPPHTDELTLPKQPQSPFTVPKQPKTPQREQLHLFDVTAPPGQQPMPGAAPVSVPGATPPTPGNPIQFPGTFSHFLPIMTIYSSEFVYSAEDELTTYFQTMRENGQPPYVVLRHDVALEQSGGKVPIPGAQPYGVSGEGVSLYRVRDLGWNPALNRRMNADEGFQGAPAQSGVYTDARSGARAEVLDWEPSLKMAYISVPLDYPEGGDVRLHPHSLVGWVDYADLRPLLNLRGRPPHRTP